MGAFIDPCKIVPRTTQNPILIKITITEEDCQKKYWETKRSNFIPKVAWSILRECPPDKLSKRKCYLSLPERLEIHSYKQNNLLSKISELIDKCRHLKNIRYYGMIARTSNKVLHVSLNLMFLQTSSLNAWSRAE